MKSLTACTDTATRALFVADLHLTRRNSPRYAMALELIATARHLRASLYILGDLFDFWANNRRIRERYHCLLDRLRALTTAGGQVGFLPGNRDFLCRPAVLRRYGVLPLAEEASLSIGSHRLLLAHGHTLCRGDIHFLRYRQRIWPLFRTLDRILPGRIENALARCFMRTSKQVIHTQDQQCFRYTPAYVQQLLDRGHDAVICGHRHQQMIEPYGTKRLYALPAWNDREGGYLRYDRGTFTFATLTP